MSTRFPETKGGYFSRDTAISEASEHIRIAAERIMSIAHHDKFQGDVALGDMFLKAAAKLDEMNKLLLMMGTKGRA